MAIREDDLSGAFAQRCVDSPEFVSWLLNQTKFKRNALCARLLHEEQALRPAKHWWRHWWCRVPELDAESETDIFLVFETGKSNRRFALHIENKMLNGKFTNAQAESYAYRAQYMANKDRYLNYCDFETVLIAPQGFLHKYSKESLLFDRSIAHERISAYIAEFSQ